jgi:hypothetical protein
MLGFEYARKQLQIVKLFLKMKKLRTATFVVGMFGAASASWAAIINLNSSNNINITQVEYVVTSGGSVSSVTQTTSASGTNQIDGPVNIVSMTGDLGGAFVTLDNFNTADVSAVNLNLPADPTGFSVINGGSQIGPSDLTAFEAAVKDSVSNENLLNYVDKAGSTDPAPGDGFDYDIIFRFGLVSTDYLVLAERDGNSAFQIRALDENGAEIVGADILQIVSGNNSPLSEWSSGYGASGDPNGNNQPMYLSIISAQLFNTTSSIFGLRIFNPGGADTKLLAASEDVFTDNPENPFFPIPEPSSYAFVLSLAALISCACRRRRV